MTGLLPHSPLAPTSMARRQKKHSNPYRPSTKPRNAKRRALFALLIVIIALAVLLALRWRAWFGNPPEMPYAPPQMIDRVTLTPGAHFTSTRTVSWRCDSIQQDSWLEYGLAAGDTAIVDRRWLPAEGCLVKSRAGKAYYYHAQLHGLKPGIAYRYRVHSGQESSERYTFTIPASQSESHFIYLGDVQDPRGMLSTQLFERLRQQEAALDFLAGAGDQVEGPTDAYWQAWYKAVGAWSPTLTQVYATGNHEYLKRGFLRELDPRWVPQYNFPANGPEGFEGRSYYIDFPLMRFIVLDSNGINGPIDIVRHRSWLASVLRSSAQPWQIVMFHHAVYTVRSGRSHPVMRHLFDPILVEEGADLVLQGHDHAYSRITSRGERGDSIAPMYVISASSPKTYRNGWDDIHERLGSGLQLYQSIRVRATELHYTAHLYDGSVYDEVVLHQRKGERPSVEDRARYLPELFEFNAFGNDAKGKKKAETYKREVEARKQKYPTVQTSE